MKGLNWEEIGQNRDHFLRNDAIRTKPKTWYQKLYLEVPWECGQKYIWETERLLKPRLKEHHNTKRGEARKSGIA